MRELLRDRRFVLLWSGQAVNTVGHGLTVVALATLLIKTHDVQTLGLVLAVDSAGMGVALIAGGVLADRYSRTMVMAASDVMRAAAVTMYAFASPSTSVVTLCAIAAVEGVGTGVFGPAWRVAIPQVVPTEKLKQANAFISATSRGGQVIGAGVGGVLVATVGSRPALLADAATYAVSLLTLLAVRLPSVAEHDAPAGVAAAVREAVDGVHAVVRRPWVLVVFLQGTVQVLLAFGPMRVLTPLVCQQRYGDGAYGVLMACVPAGGVLGALLAPRLRVRHDGLTAMHAVAPTMLPLVFLAVDVPLWVYALGYVVSWAGIAVFFVLWFSALQTAYPARIQGRVFSLEQLATFVCDPIGLALAPAVAAAVGVSAVGWGAALLILVTTYGVLLVPGVRDLRDPTDGTADTGPRHPPDESVRDEARNGPEPVVDHGRGTSVSPEGPL